MHVFGVSLISLSVLFFVKLLFERNKKRLRLLKNFADFFDAVAQYSTLCDLSAEGLVSKAAGSFQKEDFSFPFVYLEGGETALETFSEQGSLTKEEIVLLEEFLTFSRCRSAEQFRDKCRGLSESFSSIYLREKAGIAEKNKLALSFGGLGALLIFIILI